MLHMSDWRKILRMLQCLSACPCCHTIYSILSDDPFVYFYVAITLLTISTLKVFLKVWCAARKTPRSLASLP